MAGGRRQRPFARRGLIQLLVVGATLALLVLLLSFTGIGK